jgi:hypothetical protein
LQGAWEEEMKVKEEESKDLTPEQKKELEDKKRQEVNLKKLKEFDRLIKEAPKFSFNSNVFKNVKLAMDDKEREQEEQSVKELATFLNEKALEKLIADLQNVEGVPTDSESLESTFHQHGVNMRYLGEVAK